MDKHPYIAPPLCHYDSIKQLKDTIEIFIQKRKFQFEQNDKIGSMFWPEEGKFEIIRTTKHNYNLIPAQPYFTFLYRGENQVYPSFSSSLSRLKGDIYSQLIEYLRLQSFRELIDSHPVVQKVFKRNHLHISYEGLAQHYGLRTRMVDFTSSFDIAMFFATCFYDNKHDCYSSQKDDIPSTGVLYLLVDHDFYDIYRKHDFFNTDYLQNIGLQPFRRPAAQQGFAYLYNEGDDFIGLKYTFTYTKEDSEYYYQLFDGGTRLWFDDGLSEIIKEIQKQTSFSEITFDNCFRNYPLAGISSKVKARKELQKRGISIKREQKPLHYTLDEIKELQNKWNTYQVSEFCDTILHRKCNVGGQKISCMTSKILFNSHLLRMISGLADRKELPLEVQGKTEIPTHKIHRKSNIQKSQEGKWEKIPETFIDAKWTPFWTVDNLKI